MKAIVLCAGFGTRLGALVREVPKPLLPIDGVPLLGWTLSWLAANGVREVAVNLHDRPHLFESAIDDRFGPTVTFFREAALLGTAGTVRALAHWLGGGDALVVYGDLLLDQPLGPLIVHHARTGADATLLLHQRANSNSVVQLGPDGLVSGFLERPDAAERARNPFPLVNSGVQILSARARAAIPASAPADLPRDLYARGGVRIAGVPLTGFRVAIDSPERYADACAAVTDGRFRGLRPSAARLPLTLADPLRGGVS